MRFELNQVGGTDIVRDEYHFHIVLGARRHMARLSVQRLEHALHHLHHIGFALAQVGIFKRLKLFDQFIHLGFKRPFGIAVLAQYHFAGGPADMLIAEDHQVQVEESIELRCRLLRALLPQSGQFPARGFQRVIQTRHLLVYQRLGQHIVRHFQRGIRHQVCMSDSNATGDGKTMQGKTHSPSPK